MPCSTNRGPKVARRFDPTRQQKPEQVGARHNGGNRTGARGARASAGNVAVNAVRHGQGGEIMSRRTGCWSSCPCSWPRVAAAATSASGADPSPRQPIRWCRSPTFPRRRHAPRRRRAAPRVPPPPLPPPPPPPPAPRWRRRIHSTPCRSRTAVAETPPAPAASPRTGHARRCHARAGCAARRHRHRHADRDDRHRLDPLPRHPRRRSGPVAGGAGCQRRRPRRHSGRCRRHRRGRRHRAGAGARRQPAPRCCRRGASRSTAPPIRSTRRCPTTNTNSSRVVSGRAKWPRPGPARWSAASSAD